MVLHNNKWDRKQNRDRVRKLKAKGREDPAAAAKDVKDRRSGKAVGVTPAADKVEEEEEGTDGSDGSDDDEEEEAEGQKGQFARRKLASNSWRYEKAAAVGDSLLDPAARTQATAGEEEEEAEDHEDYVALTLAKKGGQWVDAQEEKIRSGAVDEAFLRESWAPGRTKQPLLAELPKRGNVVKADRKDFVDVTESIAKRNNADAFRARFDGGRSKKRTPRMPAGDPGGSGDGGSGDDLDAFLGALELDPKLAAARGGTGAGDKAAAAQSRAIRPAAVAAEAGSGDEWLDQMLGGR